MNDPELGESDPTDWRPLLYELLAVMDHMTLTAYARARPTDTLPVLSSRLGAGAVAPRQLRDSLIEEALCAADLEGCARDLLVRTIHELPSGWPAGFDIEQRRQVGATLLDWTSSFQDSTQQEVLARIAQSLLLNMKIPLGWKPSGIDDTVIAALFAQCWPRAFRRCVVVCG